MSVPWSTGERQEHLDTIIVLAGAGQRRRLFRVLDILAVMWATGDIPEERQFVLNTKVMFLKKEKDTSTTKIFDDDEWTRSLSGAQRSPQTSQKTASRMTNVKLHLKRSNPSRCRSFCQKSLQATPGATRQLGVGSQGGAEALAISISSF